MPTRDAMTRMHRQLLEAALDQPNPTPELTAAINLLLRENNHAVRLTIDSANPFNTESAISL